MKINLGLIWTMLTSTVVAVVYMFSTFASAADVERIEYQILKQALRDLRKDLRDDPGNELIKEDIEIVIDAICFIAPQDRECD